MDYKIVGFTTILSEFTGKRHVGASRDSEATAPLLVLIAAGFDILFVLVCVILIFRVMAAAAGAQQVTKTADDFASMKSIGSGGISVTLAASLLLYIINLAEKKPTTPHDWQLLMALACTALTIAGFIAFFSVRSFQHQPVDLTIREVRLVRGGSVQTGGFGRRRRERCCILFAKRSRCNRHSSSKGECFSYMCSNWSSPCSRQC